MVWLQSEPDDIMRTDLKIEASCVEFITLIDLNIHRKLVIHVTP